LRVQFVLQLLVLRTVAGSSTARSTIRTSLSCELPHTLQSWRLLELNLKIHRAIRGAEVDIFLQRVEPEHLNRDSPASGCNGIKPVVAVAVGNARKSLAVLRERNGCARYRLAAGSDKTALRRQTSSRADHERNQF